MARPVDMRLEGHAALGELAQFCEAHHLEAAGVGENGMRPVHEFVQAAERRDPLRSGRQHQMIGVGEHDIVAERPDRARIHRLDGGGGADRHEGRRPDDAARGRDRAGTRVAVGRMDREGKAQRSRALRLSLRSRAGQAGKRRRKNRSDSRFASRARKPPAWSSSPLKADTSMNSVDRGKWKLVRSASTQRNR